MNTVVGYTGGSNPNPTYRSVCSGDGHTEAIMVEFDPTQVSYETVMRRVLKQAHGGGWGGKQYQSAVWYQSDEQAAIARKVAKELGKTSVPVLPGKKWTDAEKYHQHYYGTRKRGTAHW